MAQTLPSPDSLESSPLTKTFATALLDVDAIVTTLATVASPTVVSGAGLNGAMGATSIAPFSRTLSVTTTAFASTYNTTDPIVVTGLDLDGNTITQNLLLTAAGGNQTIQGTKLFSSVVSIAIPAQLTTSGAFTFGVRDVGTVACRQLRANAAGNIKVKYSNGSLDTLLFAAGEKMDVRPVLIYGDGDTTVVGITILV